MPRLWEIPARPGTKRLPVRIKKHSQFMGGVTVTLLGTRWSRTWGFLPVGTDMTSAGTPNWLGGMSWATSARPGPLAKPTLALCKWRYR